MNYEKDFRSFFNSVFPYSTSTLDSMMSMTPYVSQESDKRVSMIDVFSRLMQDRQIFFGQEVNSETANITVAQLLYLSSLSSEKITMYINSPGGSVYAGYGILSTMGYIKPKVETICTGIAASMGSMLLMCGEKGLRKALPYTRIMIHQPLGGTRGQASDILIAAEEIGKVKKELYDIISRKTGKPIKQVEKDADRDYWMNPEEALKYGIIDEVIKSEI